MAVVSKIATIVLSGATGSRTWVATSAVQDTAAGSSVVITTTMSTGGVTPPVAPDTLDLSIRIDNSANQIINFSLNPTSASQTSTFFFTDTGLTGGSARCGIARLRLAAVNTSNGLSTNRYNVNSDDTTGQVLPTGFSVTQRDQGWIRGTTTATVTVNNTGLGNAAFTGTYAYPDSIYMRTALAARAYDLTKTLTNSTVGQTNAVSTSGVNYDSTLANGVSAANYTSAQTSRICTVSAMQSSDLVASTDWTVLTTTTQTITVDPRLTFLSVARTSSQAIVNFGFHTVTATFKAKNARNENLNATTHGTFANLVVKSLNITGSLVEKTISASVTPAGSPPETYSLSYVFNGPTLQANRGTGPQGDTAAHDTTGKTKGLRASPVSDTGNTFDSTSTLVSLSDLFRLDPHVQKTSILIPDSDHTVEPGSGESGALVVGLDQFFGWTWVGDVNLVSLSGVLANMALFDPTGAQTNEGEPGATTMSNGYSTLGFQFSVVAPVGTWRFRSRVDVNSTGSMGNYGNATTADGVSTVVGSLLEGVNFISPYTAHRFLLIQAASEAEIGAQQAIAVEYLEQSGTRLALDAAPYVRVYHLDPATGAQVDDLALSQSTRIGSTNSYSINWTPTTNGTYNIEVRAMKDQSGVEGIKQVEVRPRSVFDPTGGLFK